MYFGASLINVLASFFVQLRASSPVIRIGKANSHGHRGFNSDMADHSASFGFCSVFLLSLTGPEEMELEGPQPRHLILKRQAQEGLFVPLRLQGHLTMTVSSFFLKRYFLFEMEFQIQHPALNSQILIA